MGRQLQLATTLADEVELLRAIHALIPIRVFQVFAPTIEELWIDDWESREIPSASYRIWPQAFPWSPTYDRTGGPGCPPERAGRFYVANASTAPVLEFTRTFLETKRFGRIYWARDFSAPNGLTYDSQAFARLTDSVWRWIRKVGRKMPGAKSWDPYYLPEAWSHVVRPGE